MTIKKVKSWKRY